MNRPDPFAAWTRYLEAEEAGREPLAEQALAELFRALPESRPRRGFAGRVMRRIDAERRPGWAWLAHPAARFGLGAAVVLAALSAALAVPVLGSLARWVGPGGAVELLIASGTGLATRFAMGLAAWSPWAATGRALGLALFDPRVAAFLFALLGVATLALRGLVVLVSAQRSPVHVAH